MEKKPIEKMSVITRRVFTYCRLMVAAAASGHNAAWTIKYKDCIQGCKDSGGRVACFD